ncbi:MAG TPA: Ig-like domain-containing protein, partial [Thermoanaerobaculia bacterium]|nr:Ig-like domain-containing protein [Thermoanaerobaculia bacterium]
MAGQAVAFAPGAALAAGEAYVFRAGAGITDVAGNPLQAPAEARFTVATPRTAGAPVLDPLPAVLCADELAVTGHAMAGATIKVRDGDLVFTGFADAAGVFSVTVPVSGSGYRLLRVWALDPVSGATSPETSAVVRVDCQSPSVLEARFDRTTGVVRIVFSEAMSRPTVTVGGAGAAIHVLDADTAAYQSGTLTWPADGAAEIALGNAADAWWRNRPVRLQVGPPAADGEGNAMAASFETVFFPGGGDLSGGFLSGEVYDDASGRPLAGAEVRLYAAGAALPGIVAAGQEGAALAGATTDGRGRFVLTATASGANQVPAGRYTLVVSKDGSSRVYRRLSLRPSAGIVPFDSRLTPLAATAGELQPIAGGTVSASAAGTNGGAAAGAAISFSVDAAALPGTAPVSVRLTSRSGQGLPDFLPLGWTPAAAVELRLEQAGKPLPEQALWTSGAGRLELPLPAWVDAGDEIFAARYEAATGRWLALPTPELVAGSGAAPARARVAVAGPGTVAIVLPDESAPTRPELPHGAGDALIGVERPATVPALTAALTLDPPVVGPTGRSRARVVAHSTDNSTAWPSGLAVQAYLEEKLVLTGGGEVLEAPFSADLVLYHPELTAAEQGSAAAAAVGAMEFAVSPSPRAAQVLLEVGWENIRLFPFPEEVERGPLVGPDGGTVSSPQGVELTIPEGALATKVPVSATLVTTAELATLPAVLGYDTVAAVRIDLSGAILARAATLSLPTPAGTPADSAAAPRVILAELLEAPADGRGALPRLAARTRRAGAGAGERIVASPDLAGALPLDGIVREGLYLVLAAHQPLGFVTGLVKAGNGSPIAVSRVTADELGTGDLSALTGRYAVPANAGSNRRLQARHPSLDERGEGTLASLAAGAVASLDLVVQPVAPRVLSVTPAAGATGQPLATAV